MSQPGCCRYTKGCIVVVAGSAKGCLGASLLAGNVIPQWAPAAPLALAGSERPRAVCMTVGHPRALFGKCLCVHGCGRAGSCVTLKRVEASHTNCMTLRVSSVCHYSIVQSCCRRRALRCCTMTQYCAALTSYLFARKKDEGGHIERRLPAQSMEVVLEGEDCHAY